MRKIELEGYGSVLLTPIYFKEKPSVLCDISGNPVKYQIENRGRGVYVREDGTEILRNEVCKKLVINGEETIIRRFKPTTKIKKSSVSIIEDKQNNTMKLACERKVYIVSVSPKIKKILDEGKALMFPLVVGSGFKVWKGVLNRHVTKSGKEVICLFACRGDLDKAFDEFVDEPITLELDDIPEENAENIKKIFETI